jgi:acyl carrier protein
MIGSNDDVLKTKLKTMIIELCDKDLNPEDIKDDEVLFGSGTTLELDSMDALQISMELNKQYGLNTTDSKQLRKIMTSINTLAEYIQPQ